MSDTTTASTATRPHTFWDAGDVALLLVDTQPGLMLAADSRPHQELVNNISGLLSTVKTFDVPTVVTTSARDRFSGPLLDEFTKHTDVEPIERTVLDAFQSEPVREAIKATGRKRIIIAGALTEACVAFPAFSLIDAGYEVAVVADCCAGITKESHDLALDRMKAAGVTMLSWIQLVLEWQQDWTHRDTYEGATGALTAHGGGYGLALHHAWDMLKSPAATPAESN